MGLRKYKRLVKHYDKKEEADKAFVEQLQSFPEGSQPIMCRCIKCGGIGFAQDASLIDKSGFLKDMSCPCGGAIRKVF